MKNDNLCFEVVYWLWLGLLVNQDHTLAEVVPFKLLFLDLRLDGKADGLSSHGFLYFNAFVMDTLYLDWVKLSLLVRPKQQRLLWLDLTGQESARNNDTDTLNLVKAIY